MQEDPNLMTSRETPREMAPRSNGLKEMETYLGEKSSVAVQWYGCATNLRNLQELSETFWKDGNSMSISQRFIAQEITINLVAILSLVFKAKKEKSL